MGGDQRLSIYTEPRGFSDEEIRAEARRQFEREGELEIDDNATVSRHDDPEQAGCYVQAWVYVIPEKQPVIPAEEVEA